MRVAALVLIVLLASAVAAKAWLIQGSQSLTPCATNFVFDWTDATGCNGITAVIR